MACAHLADCYRQGIGVECNIFKATELFSVSSAMGYESGWTSLLAILNLQDAILEEVDTQGHATGDQAEEPTTTTEGEDLETSEKDDGGVGYTPLRGARRGKRVWGEHLVPKLYDVCCMQYHKMCLRLTREERLKSRETMPKEIPERVLKEIRECARFDCVGMFYGEGRVRRRFVCKDLPGEKATASDKGRSSRPRQEIVLNFCSIHCSQALSKELWRVKESELLEPLLSDSDV